MCSLFYCEPFFFHLIELGNLLSGICRVSKKTKKPIKLRKLEKITKKPNPEKKPIGSVRFYKPETKKTEPNQTQTGKN